MQHYSVFLKVIINAAAAFFFMAVLLTAALLPAKADPPPKKPPAQKMIMAHYMPWFEAKPFSSDWGWHWTMNHFKPDEQTSGKRGAASKFYPLIGLYDSGDPAALQCHVLLMKMAGINGVIFDWYGSDDYFDYASINRNTKKMLPFLARAGLKFAICYETQTVPLEIKGGKIAEAEAVIHGEKLLQEMQKDFFMSPSYVKLSGRPVLLAFGDPYYNDAQWNQILVKSSPRPLFFTEDDRLTPTAAVGGFDWPHPRSNQESDDNAQQGFYQRAEKWPFFIAAAFPRFDDIYKEAGVRDSYGHIADKGGKTYENTLARALTSSAQIVQIATWNDWGEGTQIEPSQEFGYRDLETTQKLCNQYTKNSPYSSADLRLPVKWYLLRKKYANNSEVSAKLDAFFDLAVAGRMKESRALLTRYETAAASLTPVPPASAKALHLSGPLTTKTVAGPVWAKNQPIYEVNLDSYGFAKGAALRQFEAHLPVLKDMGIGIVWFMPLTPRGYEKGFGSAYSVRDYKAINPDLGTEADFKHLVKTAHGLGLHVLVDWVPNHTAWENPLTKTHPEFYAKNEKGEITQAGPWADVAQLNYGKPGMWNMPLWETMRDAMLFWVAQFDIDGFRCDVAGRAGQVPREFWTWLRPQIDAQKSLFMLAEADDAYLHPAFDMTYGWSVPPILWDICAGRKPATVLDDALQKEANTYPNGAVRMRFLDNHDWHAHADWGWGNGPEVGTKGGLLQVAPMMVLCTALPGKPLLYNGQEMSFVRVDPALSAESRYQSPVWAFYKTLLGLYQTQPALSDGDFAKIPSDSDDAIYAFTRQSGASRIIIVVNLSGTSRRVRFPNAELSGTYRDGFSGATVKWPSAPTVDLAPWGYRIYLSQEK